MSSRVVFAELGLARYSRLYPLRRTSIAEIDMALNRESPAMDGDTPVASRRTFVR